MQTFNRLRIFNKIIAILAIAVLIFAINIGINMNALSKSEAQLEQVQKVSIHLVNLTTENVTLWRRIDEVYTQSVSFSDEDLLENADKIDQQLKGNFNKIKQLLPASSNYQNIEQQTNKYVRVSKEMSLKFINDEADFSTMGDQISAKTTIYNEISEILNKEKSKAADTFSKNIENTLEISHESRNLSVFVGLTLLAIMIVLGLFIARTISKSVESIESSLKELADGDGDLTNQLTVTSEDELGSVVKHFNIFTQMLRGIVKEVLDVVNPLSESSHKLSNKVQQIKRLIESQASVAETAKQSMQEMQFSVADITKSASEAADAANMSEIEANEGMDKLNQSLVISAELTDDITTAANVVNQLANDSQNMNQILDVINGIAEQTNLLALNAAIEAARAGEQGRGFAVVADEVRSLASRTALSTTEIRTLLDKLIGAATSSVHSMEDAREKAEHNQNISQDMGGSLSKIKHQIEHISSMNAQIAAATEEQSMVAEVVVSNIQEMYDSFAESSLAVDEFRDIATDLDIKATQLDKSASKFIV